jgi:hypothetical protein
MPSKLEALSPNSSATRNKTNTLKTKTTQCGRERNGDKLHFAGERKERKVTSE